MHGAVRGRVSTPAQFWRDAVAALQPDVALDVGANYGECFATAHYEPQTRIVAIEANPSLIPYLEKTREKHQARDMIQLVNCIASDKHTKAQPFFYRPEWTGGGSAVVPENTTGCSQATVDTRSIDGILSENEGVKFGSLVLKIDTEGFEGHVFAGFKSITKFKRVAGIIEFDTLYLSRAGTDPEQLFELLNAQFQLYDTDRRSTRLSRVRSWDHFHQGHESKELHTDLVLVTSEKELPSAWTIG